VDDARGGGRCDVGRRRSCGAAGFANPSEMRVAFYGRELRAASWLALAGGSHQSMARKSEARSYAFGRRFGFWRPESAQKLNQTGAKLLPQPLG
jgi:hypothetical protein